MLTDRQPAVLEPLIEIRRLHAKVPSPHLRRTIEAILWRHQNGVKWRSVPTEHGPCWMAAQTIIRWSRLGAWEGLLALIQGSGIKLGMSFLDGTNVRAHQKAAGASRNGDLRMSEMIVKRLASLVEAMELRLLVMAGGAVPAIAFRLAQDRHTKCRTPFHFSIVCLTCPSGWWRTAAIPATPSASTSGAWGSVQRSRRCGTRRRSPARTGSTRTATRSSGSGRGRRNGAPLPPATRKPPPASSASYASPPLSLGSGANRP
jgi:transposase